MSLSTIDTVHIVQRMAPGGIETLVLDLMGDAQASARVFSLESTAEELTAAWPALATERDRLEAFDRKGGVSPSLIRQIARRLRQLKPKTVVVHHIGPLLYGGSAAVIAGVPNLIHVEHDVWHYQKPGDRLLAKMCGIVLRPTHVAVSRHVAEQMDTIFPSSPITVITPGIDLTRFSPANRTSARTRLGLAADAVLIGSVGRLVPVKGHDTLLSALRHLPSAVQAVLVGDGPERDRLTNFAEENRLKDRVHFLGHRDDIERVLPAFDVFCLPSLNEGLPRSVLEAQACGLAVVASDVGGLSDAVCPVTGRLVPPSDEIALAKAISEVLDQPTADCGPRTFVEKYFSLEATRNAFRQICNGQK